jgi:hypothetical protein
LRPRAEARGGAAAKPGTAGLLGRLAPALGPALLGGIALAGACTARLVHTFGAERWDEAKRCLEKGAAVDVVEGEDPGTCAATRCWVAPDGEVWVTTTACDAPPDYREGTADPAGSACADALAAKARGAACPADGSGLPAPDAGAGDAGALDGGAAEAGAGDAGGG